MVNGAQIKAARKLLGWSASGLASRSFVTTAVVIRAEAGDSPIAPSVAAKIQHSLAKAGVEFLDQGQPSVRLKKTPR